MKKDDKTLKYEGLELPESLSDILEQDFWMLDNIDGSTIGMLRLPMKFTSTTSIFVRKGNCRFSINLEEYEIEAPCVVNIASSDIMQPLHVSQDFEGAFVVMSNRFVKDFMEEAREPELFRLLMQNPLLHVPPQYVVDFEMFYRQLRTLISEANQPYIYKATLHTALAFFFHTAVRSIKREHEGGSTGAMITRKFMKLARDNFKRERFMDFYARELGITSKHLGRTIKNQTGFTASEWLDKMVILEAKVLLKSSSMTIQQISEELNFPSQSFFGKYFKNIVGVSPKEFRNAR